MVSGSSDGGPEGIKGAILPLVLKSVIKITKKYAAFVESNTFTLLISIKGKSFMSRGRNIPRWCVNELVETTTLTFHREFNAHFMLKV